MKISESDFRAVMRGEITQEDAEQIARRRAAIEREIDDEAERDAFAIIRKRRYPKVKPVAS